MPLSKMDFISPQGNFCRHRFEVGKRQVLHILSVGKEPADAQWDVSQTLIRKHPPQRERKYLCF